MTDLIYGATVPDGRRFSTNRKPGMPQVVKMLPGWTPPPLIPGGGAQRITSHGIPLKSQLGAAGVMSKRRLISRRREDEHYG